MYNAYGVGVVLSYESRVALAHNFTCVVLCVLKVCESCKVIQACLCWVKALLFAEAI